MEPTPANVPVKVEAGGTKEVEFTYQVKAEEK
jgi:hypothetical protein